MQINKEDKDESPKQVNLNINQTTIVVVVETQRMNWFWLYKTNDSNICHYSSCISNLNIAKVKILLVNFVK